MRLREYLFWAAVKTVEAAGDFARQFYVRHLVFANRDAVGFVDQNVCGLQQGISQKTVGPQILILDVLALLFIGRNALQPAERRDHRKQKVQFRVSRDVRLKKEHGALGIESCRQPVEGDFERVLLDA